MNFEGTQFKKREDINFGESHQSLQWETWKRNIILFTRYRKLIFTVATALQDGSEAEQQ